VCCGFGLGCGEGAESRDDGGIDSAAVVEQYSNDLSDVFLFGLGGSR
jgi:hypothetical protein